MVHSEFYGEVKDALGHLHDYPYLDRHPLARRFWPEDRVAGPTRAQRLHRLLLEAIEALNPPGASFRCSTQARWYLLLVRRYIEGRDPADLTHELAFGQRQYFREQRRALLALAAVLWEKLPQSPSSVGNDDPLAVEVEPVLAQCEALAPAEIARGVLLAVKALADRHGVRLTPDIGTARGPIRGNRVLLRQVLLKILSYLITQAGTSEVRLRMRPENERVLLELVRIGVQGSDPVRATGHPPFAETERRLVEMMGGRWLGSEAGADRSTWRFDLPAEAPRIVLSVEDNEQVVRAFRRYLAGYGFQVVGANNGRDALRVASELKPVVITLDVMMHLQDGWEILQAIKSDPTVQHIPVIICSVLDDPELAESLGAAGYLHKPITQADLLSAVRAFAKS